MPKQAGLRVLWNVASTVGVRNLGRAASSLMSQYGDTVLYFEEGRHPGVQGCVALTIDDGLCRNGGECSLVSEVRALLRQHGARATFFVCSEYLTGFETDARDLLEDGHELGNHMTHDSHKWARGPPEEFEVDLVRCNSAIEAIKLAAVPGSHGRTAWFRAPGGKLTSKMHRVLQQHSMRHALGDCYCDDWAIEDPEFIARTLLKQVRVGSIIILHMPERGFREHCQEALRLLLEGLVARGLCCVTLTDLVERATASTPQ